MSLPTSQALALPRLSLVALTKDSDGRYGSYSVTRILSSYFCTSICSPGGNSALACSRLLLSTVVPAASLSAPRSGLKPTLSPQFALVIAVSACAAPPSDPIQTSAPATAERPAQPIVFHIVISPPRAGRGGAC